MVRSLVEKQSAVPPSVWSLVVGLFVLGLTSPVVAQESDGSPESSESQQESKSGEGERSEEEEEADSGEGEAKTVELTGEQKRLNNKAIDAITGDSRTPGPAVRYLKAALMVGPKGNVLYMALGRAYQLQGKCGKATEMFEKAVDAPHVESVPREQVMARIEKYRGDLETTCPGVLVVECSPTSLSLTVDDRSIACGKEVKLSPGSYTIEATLEDFSPRERSVEMISMKKKVVRIEFGLEAAAESAKDEVAGALSAGSSAQLEAYREAEARRQRDRIEERGRSLAGGVEQRAVAILSPDKSPGGADSGTSGGPSGSADRKPPGRRPGSSFGERIHGTVRARLPLGMYFVQLKDGDTSGGLHYGGSLITSIGYVAPPSWTIENEIQFDWLEALSANTSTSGLDLDTWRFQNELRGWWSSIGVGVFFDYRHQSVLIGNRGAEADRRQVTTMTAGPSVVVSSEAPFSSEGHFRMHGRWGPLIHGRPDYFQVGVTMAATYFELAVEYEKLTGEQIDGQPLRRGELLMLNVGARLTL